jgi:elongation factor P
MIRATELKKGLIVKIEGELYIVVDAQHVKLSKGGAVLQTKLKSFLAGSTVTRRIRSEEMLEDVELEVRQYEYLYSNGSEHVLMHKETFDQISIDDELFGDGPKYCKPNTDIQLHFFEDKPLLVTLPNAVELAVTDTSPPLKGVMMKEQYKPATLETGVMVQVPPFIAVGEVIRVDTRTGEYIERAK